MDLDKMEMPELESDELDLGLEEMELPGEAEDKEISEMISKLEDLGYRVEKIEEESSDEPTEVEDFDIDDL